jgi:hypothetical protein
LHDGVVGSPPRMARRPPQAHSHAPARGRLRFIPRAESRPPLRGSFRLALDEPLSVSATRADSERWKDVCPCGAPGFLLADGRILLLGHFQKPTTFHPRPKELGTVGFVLLDAEGLVDEQWLEALWPRRPGPAFAGNALLDAANVVWFSTPDGLRSLQVDGGPLVSAPVLLPPLQRGALCQAPTGLIVGFFGQQLRVTRRDGSSIRDLAPSIPPGSKLRGSPSLFCGEGGRMLAVFPLAADLVVDLSCPGPPDSPGASETRETSCPVGESAPGGFRCGTEREPQPAETATLLLSLTDGEIAGEVVWPHPLVAELAVLSKRRDRWRVYGSLQGAQPHRGLFTIQEPSLTVTPGPALELGTASAMIELPDGGLVIAAAAEACGSTTASANRPRLCLLDAASGALVPF